MPLHERENPGLSISAVLLALLSSLLLGFRCAVPWAAALAILSILVAAWATHPRNVWRQNPPPFWSTGEILFLTGLTLVAFVLRFYHNAEWPLGLAYDESAIALDARARWASGEFTIWSEDLSGHPFLHLSFLGWAFSVFGFHIEVLRGTCAFLGAITVPALYLLARRLGGIPLAIVAASLLTFSRWHWVFARFSGTEAIWGPLCAVLTLLGLRLACEGKMYRGILMAGLATSAGLYTYNAFRLFPFGLVLALPLTFWVAWKRGGRPLLTRVLLGGFAYAGIVALVVGPLAWFAWTHWEMFSYRFKEVSVLIDVNEQKSLAPLLDNALRYLGMFHYAGSIRAASNLPYTDPWQPGVAMLCIPWGTCFLLGLGRILRRGGSPFVILILGTMLAALLPGFLTRVWESPHTTRALVVVPFVALVSAEGLVGFSFLLPRARLVFMGAVLALVCILEWRTLGQQLRHPEAWWDYFGDINATARRMVQTENTSDLVLSPRLQNFPGEAIVKFWLGGKSPRDFPTVKPGTTLPPLGSVRDTRYYLLPPETEVLRPIFAQVFPLASLLVFKDDFNRILFEEYTIPAQTIRELRGLAKGTLKESSSLPFSAGAGVWRGALIVPETGFYQIGSVPSGSRIWMDGVESKGRPMLLDQGFAEIRIERGKPASAWNLVWQTPGAKSPVPIPETHLLSVPEIAGGLTLEYFENPRFEGTPRWRLRDLVIFPRGLSDHPYSLRWTGQLEIRQAGRYTFRMGADETAGMWLDGKRIVDIDSEKQRPSETIEVTLTPGLHALELRYANAIGSEALEWMWLPPGQEHFSTVPFTALKPSRP